MTDFVWRTIAFAAAPPGWELRWLGDGDNQPVTRPIAGWLTQEQVDLKGNRIGVAAVRVIAGYHRYFADDAPTEAQEDEEGYMAAEVNPADEPGWHVFWNGEPQA